LVFVLAGKSIRTAIELRKRKEQEKSKEIQRIAPDSTTRCSLAILV
jgi:hypothetical protein